MLNLQALYDRLCAGDGSALTDIYVNKQTLQKIALDIIDIYKRNGMTDEWKTLLDLYIKICNLIYDNFDAMTIIEDGVYDKLMVIYKEVMPENYQIGSIPTNIQFTGSIEPEKDLDGYYCPFSMINYKNPNENINQWLFKDSFFEMPPFHKEFYDQKIDRTKYPINDKVARIVPHKYPKLVGTLDKCKFVLIKEAVDAGVADDPTVKIFERDFLGKHLQMGILNPNHIELLVELKMDGMSVEADVTNQILSARSRGDTAQDLADDLSVVFDGYQFPNCPPIDDSFGMKFECIITKTNLQKLAELRGRPYKNARNGVIGLIKSQDAYAFRDLVTLVPLETSLDIDPVTEVKFMNQYYTKDVCLPYAVISGDYNSVLYQVYRFVQEAEMIKPIMNYLYDGVVVHYIDPQIRQILGRVNSVNQYSMAIKFNPMQKQTVFRGYTYTVGQDGRITPMAHYDPVEFLGTIHTKSSCHSFGRFKELKLAKGDVINVTYVNDVMPYVTKPFESEYREEFSTAQPIEQFPTHCPCCGTALVFSEGGAGDQAICPNINCPDRVIARMANMMDKLGIKGFAESSIKKLGAKSFTELMQMPNEPIIAALGVANGNKFIQARAQFLSTPIMDYRLIGSIGFTNVAAETWKKILNAIPLDIILTSKPYDLFDKLVRIKSIGTATANIIVSELPLYANDIASMRLVIPIIYTYGQKQKIIRWTGCRDAELEKILIDRGYDASSKSGVTKSTDLLIVPYIGYSSTKLNKIGPNTKLVAIDELKKNLDHYLNQL